MDHILIIFKFEVVLSFHFSKRVLGGRRFVYTVENHTAVIGMKACISMLSATRNRISH